MKANGWITGIFLSEYETDESDGKLVGFDVDFGEMVAFNGKLIPLVDYEKIVGKPEWNCRGFRGYKD